MNSQIISHAVRLATAYAVSAEKAIHVEVDDLAGAALLAKAQGRDLRHGIIDELRRIGGDRRKGADRRLWQFPEHFEIGSAEPKYIVRMALKRCGVLMLKCLSERHRRVIMLRYWHGLSQPEVAAELKVSYGRISQIERRACEILAVELRRRGIKSLRDVI